MFNQNASNQNLLEILEQMQILINVNIESNKVKSHTLESSVLREGRSNGKTRSIKMLSVINLPTSGIPAEITSLK